MRKQNLTVGMSLSLATCFVAFINLILPIMLLMQDSMSGSGSATMDGKTIFFVLAHGMVAIFGLVFTILAIISICKLGNKDDEKVAKKKGLYIATIVFQAIVLVACIIVSINAFKAINAFMSVENQEEGIANLMMFGSSYIALIGATVVHLVAFIVNLVAVIKLKKPVTVEAK